MKHLFTSSRDFRLIFACLFLMAIAVGVYQLYFDILIPNIPDDSYRAAVGWMFIIPILVLTVGQTVVSSIMIQTTTVAVRQQADFLKSLAIGAALTAWFSLTYAWFPKYGPFYYIMFVYGEAPWYALPLEAGWTAGGVLLGILLIRRLQRLSLGLSVLLSVVVYLFINVAAS